MNSRIYAGTLCGTLLASSGLGCDLCSVYSAAQLKIIQEVITLVVFCGFAVLYLGEKIRWNYIAAFVCVLGAVAFAFLPQK